MSNPIEGALKKTLLEALLSYRCTYTIGYDGDSLPLVDVLSPGETIADGKCEIALLAEHLDEVLQCREEQEDE